MTEPTETPSDAGQPSGRDSLGRDTATWLAPARLAIGLLQGLGLYGPHRLSDGAASWGATHPLVLGPLLLVVAFLPVMLLAGVGRVRPLTLAIWTAVAGVVLALLGLHDIARQSADTLQGPPFLSPQAVVFSAVALFIAHHLVAPADMERRRIASYSSYFDTATKAAAQLALSIGFTGAFWILLHLGAALFRIINLDFLETLMRQTWFVIPVTCVVFATAVHLTDVRDGLIRGVRTLALMLLSWLLLVITVLVAGFLAALPFTGLGGLWAAGSGVSLVLAAAAALIILINAAYQDGRPDNRPPAVLRVAVRVAAVLITPLIVIAVWGLALRIGQYGLTPDRIIAAACALVGASFAAGYGWAALSPFWRKGDWMRPLERTTIWTAVLTVAVILALFSPLLDPARLSVADQVARLERGAVTPDRFDYAFLRFGSGKAGKAALERLTGSRNPEISRRAAEARTQKNRWDRTGAEGLRYGKPVIDAFPAGLVLPERFTSPALPIQDDRRGCNDQRSCLATMIDLNGDGSREILLGRGQELFLFEPRSGGEWEQVGAYDIPACKPEALAAIRSGKLRPAPAGRPDLAGDGWTANFRNYNNAACGLHAPHLAPPVIVPAPITP